MISAAALLLAPKLPQAVDGVIDVHLLQGNVIYLDVPYYSNIAQGDVVRAFFGILETPAFIVPYVFPSPPAIILKFNADDIPIGSYQVWYSVTDLAGNTARSAAVKIGIVNSLNSGYPAPVFPDAVSGKLSIAKVIKDNGVRVRAVYPSIAVGDKLVFVWYGVNADGEQVAESQYTSSTLSVSGDDVDLGYLQAVVPTSYVLPIGNGGAGSAKYSVSLSDGRVFSSPEAEVTLLWNDIDFTLLVVSEGAPQRDFRFPYLNGALEGMIFGRPGAQVHVSVPPGGTVDSPLGGHGRNVEMTLGATGATTFSVSKLLRVGQGNKFEVEVVSDYAPFSPIVKDVVFSRYTIGKGSVKGYAFTTGAVADGRTPCCLYVMCQEGVNSVTATVAGNALISGRTSSFTMPLHSDGTGTLSIVNERVDVVSLTFWGGDNSAAAITIPIEFVKLPGVGADFS